METATTDTIRNRTAPAAGVVAGFASKRGPVFLVAVGVMPMPIRH